MKLRVIILGLLSALPLILAFLYLSEFLAVDAALDSGASYDYATGQADYLQNHPHIPFYSRHALLIWVSLISLSAAVIYQTAAKRRTANPDV